MRSSYVGHETRVGSSREVHLSKFGKTSLSSPTLASWLSVAKVRHMPCFGVDDGFYGIRPRMI